MTIDESSQPAVQRVYGLDFTSAPRRGRKAITVASAELVPRAGGPALLRLAEVLHLWDFEQLERSLAEPGPWVLGLDLPFGLPRELVEVLGWPTGWEAMVAEVGRRSKGALEALFQEFCDGRPAGSKHLKRATDRAARSQSPMKFYGTPLAKMLHAGVPRLAASGVSVLPCRPSGGDRVAVEIYPALVVESLLGERLPYKGAGSGEKGETRAAGRRRIVQALAGDAPARLYGVELPLEAHQQGELLADPAADRLDAVLALLPTAWSALAAERPDAPYGIPPAADPLEGWIVDPSVAPFFR